MLAERVLINFQNQSNCNISNKENDKAFSRSVTPTSHSAHQLNVSRGGSEKKPIHSLKTLSDSLKNQPIEYIQTNSECHSVECEKLKNEISNIKQLYYALQVEHAASLATSSDNLNKVKELEDQLSESTKQIDIFEQQLQEQSIKIDLLTTELSRRDTDMIDHLRLNPQLQQQSSEVSSSPLTTHHIEPDTPSCSSTQSQFQSSSNYESLRAATMQLQSMQEQYEQSSLVQAQMAKAVQLRFTDELASKDRQIISYQTIIEELKQDLEQTKKSEECIRMLEQELAYQSANNQTLHTLCNRLQADLSQIQFDSTEQLTELHKYIAGLQSTLENERNNWEHSFNALNTRGRENKQKPQQQQYQLVQQQQQLLQQKLHSQQMSRQMVQQEDQESNFNASSMQLLHLIKGLQDTVTRLENELVSEKRRCQFVESKLESIHQQQSKDAAAAALKSNTTATTQNNHKHHGSSNRSRRMAEKISNLENLTLDLKQVICCSSTKATAINSYSTTSSSAAAASGLHFSNFRANTPSNKSSTNRSHFQ